MKKVMQLKVLGGLSKLMNLSYEISQTLAAPR